jgi:hypothetical protein
VPQDSKFEHTLSPHEPPVVSSLVSVSVGPTVGRRVASVVSPSSRPLSVLTPVASVALPSPEVTGSSLHAVNSMLSRRSWDQTATKGQRNITIPHHPLDGGAFTNRHEVSMVASSGARGDSAIGTPGSTIGPT